MQMTRWRHRPSFQQGVKPRSRSDHKVNLGDRLTMNQELKWETADAFFESTIGEVELYQHREEDWEDEGFLKETRKHVRIGEDLYELHRYQAKDSEGSSFSEEWRKNGELHREGGFPAQTIRNEHYIPSESYLDESTQKVYLNGQLQEYTDSTYEDVLAQKPLSVRQYFGYDLDN
jgi:hypothetical protein